LRKKLKIGYWKMKVLARYPDKLFTDSHTPASLKAEIVCLWAALITLAPALFFGLWWLPLVFAAAFGAIGFPFCRALWPGKAGLAVRAPLFLTLRSLGLGAGMLLGLVGRPMRQLSLEKRMEKAAVDVSPSSHSPEGALSEGGGAAVPAEEAAGASGSGVERAPEGPPSLQCPSEAAAPEREEEKVAQHA
ncbi:MAG: hypothetical protein JXA90_17295, partial [Planctomycetes bacterium]|nr:hypothetical protein [Planctomycetota bacterium]